MLAVSDGGGGIPGDPAAVDAAAATLRAAAGQFTDTADSIGSHRRALVAEWTGTASDAASDHLDRLVTRTRVGTDVTASAAAVLEQYAATLRTAQSNYTAATSAAASASAAQSNAQNALAAAQTAGTAPAVVPGVSTTAVPASIPAGITAPDPAALSAATSALSTANAAASAAADATSDALALAAAADAHAASAIDALIPHLTAMGDGTKAGHGSTHPREHEDHWYAQAWHAVDDFAKGPLKNGEAAVGEAAWQAGPGVIAFGLHHSPFADDRAVADDIDHAHDWLQKKWGTETDSHTFKIVGDVAFVGSLVLTDGEAGAGAGAATRAGTKGVEAGEAAGTAAKVTTALTEAQQARVAALPARYRSLDVLTEQAGQRGAWNKALYKPEANKIYLVDDRHTFITDARGRVEHVQSDLEYRDPTDVEAHRHGGQQTAAGGADRLQFDQAGHLVAASLGGPGEGINLVAMHKDLNGAGNEASWGAMEKQLRETLKNNPEADIKFRVDIRYGQESLRPDAFNVRYSINGSEPVLRRFTNG